MAEDHVFRVPVKSLVRTEESDEERARNGNCNRRDRGNDGDRMSSSESESDSAASLSAYSSSSTDTPSSEGSRRIPNTLLETAINHLFLPKRLPDTSPPNLVDIELWILQHFTEACSDVLRFEKLHRVGRMLSSWRSIQPRTSYDRNRFAQKFSYELCNMSVDDTLPIYVRKQNCTLLISKLRTEDEINEGNNFRIETFRPSLPSETIMSGVGSLQVTFPETSDFIYNSEMLLSKVFAKQLHELTMEEFQVSMMVSSKADSEFIEHREVPDPFLITDWLIALLVPSSNKKTSEALKITKKIRDEVNCKRSASAVPFRRSGMLTSIKVALYLKLLHMIGNENDAKIIYKCLLLKVLAEMTKLYEEKLGRQINIDLAGQMIAKLGRRVRKLHKMAYDKQSKFADEIRYFWSCSLKMARSVVETLNEKMKDIWNEVCAASVCDIIEPIQRTKSQFQDDLLHYIPWLNEFIAKQVSAASVAKKFSKDEKKGISPSGSPLHSKSRPGSLQVFHRCTTLEEILDNSGKFDSHVQRRVWLYDTEKFIKFQLEEGAIEGTSSTSLTLFSKTVFDLVLAYVKHAIPHYTFGNCGNPLGVSQMLLAVLKVIQILDSIATRQHPLLLQYKAGISHGSLDKLLLPHTEDMVLLDDILDYFRERDLRAEFPGILDNLLTDVSEDSLASRYFARNPEMGKFHKQIVDDMEDSIKEKQKEVEKARDQCILIRDDLEKRKESCEVCSIGDVLTDVTVSQPPKCKECTKLEESLEQKRYSVPTLELLLPTDAHLQHTVVFELLIPEEIKYLREILALLKFDLLKEQRNKTEMSNAVQQKWTYFKNLKQYRYQADQTKVVITPHHQLKVNLSSKLLPITNTHHTRIQNPDLLSPYAVKGEVDDGTWPYVVPNGMDVVYHYTFQNIMGISKLEKLSAFHVESTIRSSSDSVAEEKPLDNPYTTLQWALEGTSHTQNRIIAEFSTTHHPELIAFGSLRAGHRIQLMNLYRYIANRELQLEKEPVFALILQTLWEVGPRQDYNAGPRESHLDFLDKEFTEDFLDLLEKLVESNDTNYANPLLLCCVVVITGRVLELNAVFRPRCYQILKKCRQCAGQWVQMIENEMGNRSGLETLDENARDEERNLNKMLLEITICSALTFNVSSSHFDDVLQDGGDLMNWFDTLSRLYELSQESELCDKSLSPFGQLLLEMAKDVPLKLNLESRLSSSPMLKDVFVKALHLFTCEKWDWATGAGTWKLMDDKELSNVVVGKYQEDTVTFDLIQGIFQINGYAALSGIPVSLLNSPLFEQYFRGTRKLKVVQDGVQQNGVVLFRTTDKFYGKHYKFEVKISSENVTIREIQENNSQFELLNPEKFLGVLSDEHVYQYSHWIDLNEKIVYFRRIPGNEADYLLPPELQLKTHDETQLWLLHDLNNNSFVFNRKSQGFDIVSGALTRLEQEIYMNIMMSCGNDGAEEKEGGQVIVKLPRYHLNFILVDGHLYSVEYKGYKVAYNQAQKGTLISLQHGLLLDNLGENFSTSGGNVVKRLLIVPHGKLIVVGGKIHHHRTKVSLGHLRQPPFFSYELDPVLKRLKADKSKCAWIYLAALHGYTSSGVPCLPDPFTELTGTEMAVQILQSGCVWSCSPYDYESMTSLKMIRKLAPRREYYGHGLRTPFRSPMKRLKVGTTEVPEDLDTSVEQMETTDWPVGLPSMAAFDGYAIIVDLLVADSNRLKLLYPGALEETSILGEANSYMETFKTSDKLRVRAYYRHLSAYNKAALVKPHFFQTPVSKFNENFNDPELLVRKRPGLREGEDEDDHHNLNLRMLLRISQARVVSTLEDLWNGSRRKSDLYQFLIGPRDALEASKNEMLYPALPIPEFTTSNGVKLNDLLETDFKQNWLKFYMMAVHWTGSVEARQAFSIVLSVLAYRGAPIDQLLNLHNISVLAENINFPLLPESVTTCMFSDYGSCDEEFNEEEIRRHLQEHARSGSNYRISYQHGRHVRESDGEHKLSLEETRRNMEYKIELVINELKQLWPCEKISNRRLDDLCAQTERFWNINDLKMLNLMLTKWFRNYHLKRFVEGVESYLDKFYDHFPKYPPHQKQFDIMKELKVELQLVAPPPSDDFSFEHVTGFTIEGDLDEPGVIFFSGSAFQETNVETMIPTQREQCLAKIEMYLQRVRNAITGTSSKQIIFLSGLGPRTNPVHLLQCLYFGIKIVPGSLNPGLLKLLGALAVLWTELKRFNRIVSLTQSKNTAASELKTELENCGHENWSPAEYPEWLLLELELDIMIRPIQVDVAHQMMEMPDGKSGVMQLNMGEGKTSVIVPMLCLALANGKDALCRVTVLNSIFKTNLNLLTFAIGGPLLSRRVYTFPCRRDMGFNVDTLDKILECYQECLKMKGVVLTLPEYRLSFRLLAFDKTLKGYPEIGVKFMQVENGLRNFCRDILDESDELLNVKYQLVYTIGLQVGVDGGALRWTTCQKLLQIVQEVAWVFLGKMGHTSVEFHNEQQTEKPEQFAHFRLLDKDSHEEFMSLVADELLKELKLTERQKQVVKKFLTQEKISLENFKFVLSLFKNDATQLDEIRLLSGYLRRGILALALSKRWRVEFGVDPRGNYRRMAVPFRAKDFAAERTEFGHPDLAIVLTHLSYYYSGLSNSQLQEVFDILKVRPEAEIVYSSWMGRFASEDRIPKFLLTYSGINLQDAYQRLNLFNLLRKHKGVIDFWLAQKVLPEECKQFPGKIVMSAWDLCHEKQRLPSTGFSGTNDSSILLPLPISQQDLAKLQNTNQKMERTLLETVNELHKGLEMGVTCKVILEEMKKDSLKVLIDAGALMLELDNEQVAQLWLDIDPEIEAAVYFSRDNEILVKCRKDHREVDEKPSAVVSQSKKNRKKKDHEYFDLESNQALGRRQHQDTPLELSPYRDRLEKCGVFLDDQHTRGTDLKFPVGSKACVTIGSRMRRDKLMQACMRMRQLGNGHSVTFYLSHEAKSKVVQMGTKRKKSDDSGTSDGDDGQLPGQITTQAILRWVTENSKEHNYEGLVYWALSGKNYAQKLAAQEFHDMVDTHDLEKIYCLSKQCVDDEVLTLKDMYGTYTEAELLVKLIPAWFESTQRKLLNVEGCLSLSQRIMRRFDGIRDAITTRCMDHIPEKAYLTGGLTTMEEEQEKEVELERETETEEERQVIQPKKIEYMEPSCLHENVKQAVLHGQKISVKPGISHLSDIFSSTSFAKLVQTEGWAIAEAYATTEFISVVKSQNEDEQQDGNNHFKTDSHLRPIEYLVSIRPQVHKPEKSSRKSAPVTPAPLQILVLSPFEVNELLPYFREGKAQTHLHMFSARRFKNQDLLINNTAVQVPRPLVLQAFNGRVILNIIPDSSKCLAALLVASGNLYFSSMDEQQAFAKFLGLVPRPWTAEQMNAFEKEFIKKTGFLLPKFRRQEMDSCMIEQGAFQKDPIPLVRKILMCRHAVVSEVAHVSKLLNHNWYVDLD